MQGFRHSSFNSASSNSASQQTRQQLERLWNTPVSAPASRSIPVWLKSAGQYLFDFLTGRQPLRIWTQDTRNGKFWRVYDSVNDVSHRYSSEAELRIWLEQRHNRH